MVYVNGKPLALDGLRVPDITLSCSPFRYAMFEHSFYTRGGPAAASASDGADADARGVFRFAPVVAPIKATVFPLLQKADLNEV